MLLTTIRTELTGSERLKAKTGKTITMPRYYLEQESQFLLMKGPLMMKKNF